MNCKNCGLPITQKGASARRSPTGWSHGGGSVPLYAGWHGIRCPGMLCGAEPTAMLDQAFGGE